MMKIALVDVIMPDNTTKQVLIKEEKGKLTYKQI